MEKFNLIAVIDVLEENVLMCMREKQPYKGLYNLVGGKVETEDFLEEAYRELGEETGITKKDIILEHLMDFRYTRQDLELQVYYGFVEKNIVLKEEINKLKWISMEEEFSNLNKFAGVGNIHHILNIIKER